MAPPVEIAQKTHPGRDPDKQVNEDSSAVEETALGLLCVVCDGMGGHAGGQEASRLAVLAITEDVKRRTADASPTMVLREALTLANARVHAMKPDEPLILRPGSTCVTILVTPHGTYVAHVGDSRAYLVHAGAIQPITRDHSKVQLLLDGGYITLEEARVHPDSNQITRALGIAPEVDVEVRKQPITHASGDVFVLCTDGLTDLVQPEDILRVAQGPAQQAAGQLVDLANARGGHDNITVLIVRMKEAAARVVTLLSQQQIDPTQLDLAPHTAPLEGAPRLPPTAIDADATLELHEPLIRAPDISADASVETHVPLIRPEHVHVPDDMPHGPMTPRSPIMTDPPSMRPRSPLVFVAVGVGVFLFIAVLALLYMENRKHRHNTPLIIPTETAPSATETDADAGSRRIEQAEPLPSASAPPRDERRRRRQGGAGPVPTLPPTTPTAAPTAAPTATPPPLPPIPPF